MAYSIATKNEFSGLLFFKKLKKVSFELGDKKVAELYIDANTYKLNFADGSQMTIESRDSLGFKFQVTDTTHHKIWNFNSVDEFIISFRRNPSYTVTSSNTTIEIALQSGSFIYSVDKKIIGRVEEKNMFFSSGKYVLDIFNEAYTNILIACCCIEAIRYHVLRVYESDSN